MASTDVYAEKRSIKLLVFVWAITSVLGICVVIFAHHLLPHMLPVAASPLARDQDFTIALFSAVAVPVAMLVWVVAAYSVIMGGSKEMPTEEGPRIHGNIKVQIAWLGTSALLCVGLIVYGLALLPSIYTPGAGRNLVVDVTGQQWQWTFSYPGYGKITTTSLELPVGVPVTFDVTSVDVDHSFWIPSLGVKVDANPGQVTTSYVTADVAGTYVVRCAELCGLFHAYMQAPVHVVSDSTFNSWIASMQSVHA